MNITQKKTTFGLIIGTRNIFNTQLAAIEREKLLNPLKKLGFDYVIPSACATKAGAIETRADAGICAELFKANRDAIYGIIVVLPNFGDELGIFQTLETANLDVPVLVQACNDEADKVDVKR